MKKLLLLIPALLLLISCASKQSEEYETDYPEYDLDYNEEEKIINHKDADDNFLGDFDVIRMPDIMMLSKTKKDVKPKQLNNNYLVPRSNSVEITFRDVANVICVKLNKQERDKLLEVCNRFLNEYESKTLPHHKNNSKNAYIVSKTTTWFGISGPATECSKTTYYLDCEFINKKPYLLIKFLPSRCDEKDAFSPTVSLYMSPSQIRDFIEVMDQEYLNSLVDDLIEKAYTY